MCRCCVRVVLFTFPVLSIILPCACRLCAVTCVVSCSALAFVCQSRVDRGQQTDGQMKQQSRNETTRNERKERTDRQTGKQDQQRNLRTHDTVAATADETTIGGSYPSLVFRCCVVLCCPSSLSVCCGGRCSCCVCCVVYLVRPSFALFVCCLCRLCRVFVIVWRVRLVLHSTAVDCSRLCGAV